MKMIRDLHVNTKVDEIELTIVAKEPARFHHEENKKDLRSVAVGRDRSGEIKIVLWGLEATEVELGDRIVIRNGWVYEWLGDRELVSGKFGHISIVQEDSS